MHLTYLFGNITDNTTDYVISIVYGCIGCQYISKYTTGLYAAGISKVPDNICCPVCIFMSYTGIIIILVCQNYISRICDVYQYLLAGIRCQEDFLQVASHLCCGQIQYQFGIVVYISSAIISGRYTLHLSDLGCNGLLNIVLYLTCNQLVIRNKFSSQSIAVFFINRKLVALTGQCGKLITASITVICRIYQCCLTYVHGHGSIVVCEVTDIAAVSPGINMSLQSSDCNITFHVVGIGIFVSINSKGIGIA